MTLTAEFLSRCTGRDRQAIQAYEKHCAQQRLKPDDTGRVEWVKEWRDCDEEDRLAAIEAMDWEP